ncbi:MAG: hypothetical protein HUK05_00355 [Prevotella sp.]|nr:hypothetical protein [Prevotella sp.]
MKEYIKPQLRKHNILIEKVLAGSGTSLNGPEGGEQLAPTASPKLSEGPGEYEE